MTTLRIGAHVGKDGATDDPLAEAAARQADLVQIFLGDPQGWKDPVVAVRRRRRRPARGRRRAGLDLYVHAPYRLNVATANNRIRIPSRKLLAQARRRGRRASARKGIDRARRSRAQGRRPASRASTTGPRPSSAGAAAAGADREHRGRRRRDGPPAGPAGPAVGGLRGPARSPPCSGRSASASTPATRTPAARSWPASSTGSRRSPGGSTWCTANDSRDEFDSGADRHANFGSGHDRRRRPGRGGLGGRCAGGLRDARRRRGPGRRHRLAAGAPARLSRRLSQP